MSTTLLEARALRCERNDRVLFENLDLDVAAGDVIRIAGPNGAGKTTLLKILAGLNTAFEGQLAWRGKELQSQRERYHANMLFMGHRAGVTAAMTPIENLHHWLGLRRASDEDALWQALSDAGLEGFEDAPAGSLSAGQQRRVALARLYLSAEPLWLLDEAFTAIDQDAVAVMEELISNRARQGGAVILSTHHRPELLQCRNLELKGI